MLSERQTKLIADLFVFHAPAGDQASRYDSLRQAARGYASIICELTPESPEQTLALRALHVASMQANAAIACNEVVL